MYYYKTLKEKLISELKVQSSLAFTTDTWTSCATEGYLTLTVHYIDETWHLKHFVLSTIEVKDHHTGDHLADVIIDICRDFQITDVHVSGITTDNASNDNKADMATHQVFRTHTLQLSVKAGLKVKGIASAAAAARMLVGHFKKSTLAANDLRARQKQLGLPHHSLLQDFATRWNSTFFMFERLIEQGLAVFAVLHNPAVTSLSDARRFELSDDVWRTIEEITPVLKPLQIATTTMSGSNSPTLSLVYPIVLGLLTKHLIVGDGDSVKLIQFKQAVSQDLSSGFPANDDLCRHPAVLTCALDPRYKSLRFLSEDQRQMVRDSIIQLEDPDNTNTTTNDRTVDPEAFPVHVKQEHEISAIQFLCGDLIDLTEEVSSPSSSFSLEYDTFLKEIVSGATDPLDLWKVHHTSYPRLARLTKLYLSIPGTSVPSERVVSDTGNLVTKRRASLIFLKGVLKLDYSENDTQSSETVPTPAKQIKLEPQEPVALPPLPQLEIIEEYLGDGDHAVPDPPLPSLKGL
ncbi:zinc finger BED domain-containing protein 4-like [Pecten maximus]|uniref:zinc finger BED domain-containing protein 4-like n=1 Tax=Pecten maximus TaxID=6579 RepID=UPI0014586164|nr:zinc finger BED domain-containing protein 4-like [Pecten maximus]